MLGRRFTPAAAYTFTAADRGMKVFDVTLPTAGRRGVTATDGGGRHHRRGR